eukprot:CAMPEP_0117019300 /NCGR_PEP_ID=MMETSP0472-20121206/14832_1 /TAXON_ID=693140 ORGANISM="Tiarina fusus, Strain LIS" /NCGR_SAMPLE_ID=MMETSP0472 /ASSEMBLY_ACC=CAM_ASM_000603 /LENGTH=307 /DNA_ID=CAMNT_0004724235 /DNA_START=275 /DNA_END=1198 /DNA_ORIENTATION=+
MNNLLGNFQEEWNDEELESSDEEEEDGDVEMNKQQQQQPTNQPNYMDNFFREVDSIKTDVDAVSEAAKHIAVIHEQALSATTNDEEQALSRQLRPVVENTNKRAQRTKTLLKLLKEETDKLTEEKTLNASDIRIRENLITTITRKFVDVMKIYQQAQQQYKNDIKKKAKRQIQVIKPDATDDEVDTIMQSEGGRDALLKQAVLVGGVSDEIQTTYAKVAGKYQDVMTLEQSVAELHQMFLDFALLTEQQGELLDQIEYQVGQAADHVEVANEETYQAIEYQKAIRKKQCMIIGIVVAVMLVLVVAVF